jgi:hypothetical protein
VAAPTVPHTLGPLRLATASVSAGGDFVAVGAPTGCCVVPWCLRPRHSVAGALGPATTLIADVGHLRAAVFHPASPGLLAVALSGSARDPGSVQLCTVAARAPVGPGTVGSAGGSTAALHTPPTIAPHGTLRLPDVCVWCAAWDLSPASATLVVGCDGTLSRPAGGRGGAGGSAAASAVAGGAPLGALVAVDAARGLAGPGSVVASWASRTDVHAVAWGSPRAPAGSLVLAGGRNGSLWAVDTRGPRDRVWAAGVPLPSATATLCALPGSWMVLAGDVASSLVLYDVRAGGRGPLATLPGYHNTVACRGQAVVDGDGLVYLPGLVPGAGVRVWDADAGRALPAVPCRSGAGVLACALGGGGPAEALVVVTQAGVQVTTRTLWGPCDGEAARAAAFKVPWVP